MNKLLLKFYNQHVNRLNGHYYDNFSTNDNYQNYEKKNDDDDDLTFILFNSILLKLFQITFSLLPSTYRRIRMNL